MCYDPDVSKIVTEHHLKEADEMRRRGQEQKAREYLRKHNITKDQITYKYAHLKNI